MPDVAVFCVPALDGVPVTPCGTYQGVAMVPEVLPVAGGGPLDYSSVGPLMFWAMSLPLAAYMIGCVVGAIIHVLRSV